jgi:CBS domain-containing protein
VSIIDLARTEVVTVQLDDTLRTAARALRNERVGSAVVLNAKGEPCGIVTDRDIVVYGMDDDIDPDDMLVNDVMAVDVVTVPADADVLDVIARMREESVRRLPVVDGDDLAGIVTLDDLVVLLAGELSGLADVIRAESPPYADADADAEDD